ncbi:MAG: substrate-binding domain-containing protein [Chloroflexi bacterium]|nr:substrate-binding domain-containing protein [Chloroflexota bacterium]
MNKSKRQDLILQQLLNAAPQQLHATSELAEQFGVSESTIRRDLQHLADSGLLQRQYGGAQLRQPAESTDMGSVGILLVSRIDKYRDPFYNMVLEGVDRGLERFGYHIAFVKTLYEIGTTAQAERLLESFDIKGLILLGTDNSESITYLRQHVSPIVSMTDKHDIEDDLVIFDGEHGIRMMVRHLANLEYGRLAFITGYADIRDDGFCKGLVEYGLVRDASLHLVLEPGPSGWTPDLGERGAELLMSRSKKPDAIVCASDRLAIGAMAWLQQNGYRVPEDIAVTGFDNIPDSQFTFPPVTTVHVHKVRLGELAAERLVTRINNPDDVRLKIITPTHLVVRHSCGA